MTQNRSQKPKRFLTLKLYNTLKKLYIAVTVTPKRRSFCYSIALHVAFVIGLVVLACVLQSKKNTMNLAGQRAVVKLDTTEIVQATAISSKSLDEQEAGYQIVQRQAQEQVRAEAQKRQEKIKAIEQKIASAHEAELMRQQALRQKKEEAEEERLKTLAEVKRKAEEEAKEVKKAQEEKQNALVKKQEMQKQEQKEKLRQKQQELQKQKELKAEQQQKEDQLKAEKLAEQKAKEAAVKATGEAALKALRQSALNDLNAQSAEALAQTATENALQAYAKAYKTRIEAVWIMDDCRKISADHLPTVMVMPGSSPTILVSSGSSQCDRSLLLAFKNAQAPVLPKDDGARKLIAEGVDFKFGQKG